MRAVVGVNVLVSAARTPNGLCGRLLETAIDGCWQPVVSMTLFKELEDVLARPAFRDRIGQEAIDRFLAGLLAIAGRASAKDFQSLQLTQTGLNLHRLMRLNAVSVEDRARLLDELAAPRPGR